MFRWGRSVGYRHTVDCRLPAGLGFNTIGQCRTCVTLSLRVHLRGSFLPSRRNEAGYDPGMPSILSACVTCKRRAKQAPSLKRCTPSDVYPLGRFSRVLSDRLCGTTSDMAAQRRWVYGCQVTVMLTLRIKKNYGRGFSIATCRLPRPISRPDHHPTRPMFSGSYAEL